MMGIRKWDDVSLSAAYEGLAEAIMKIQGRLGALEAAREQPPKPEPEEGWVILRESSKWLRYYDRELGFVRAGGDHFHRPAIFSNSIDAERVVGDLRLRSLPFGADGAEVVRVGYIGGIHDLTDYKESRLTARA